MIKGTAISSITIPAKVTSCNSTSYRGPLSGASELREVCFEDGMETVPANVCSWSSGETSHVETVVIPGTVETIGSNAFSNCKNLKKISLSKSVTSIGGYAFSGCSALQILNTTPKLTSIGSDAFKGCSELVLYGTSGSYAEKYAIDNNIPFNQIREGEYSLSGKLEAVLPEKGTVKIEEAEYAVADDFDMSAATQILVDSSDKMVICNIVNGRITYMEAAESLVTVQATVSSTAAGDSSLKYTYENGAFDRKLLPAKVRVSCGAKSSDHFSGSDLIQHLSAYSVSVTGVKLTMSGAEGILDVYSFADMVPGKMEYTPSKTMVLKAGESKEFNLVLGVDSGYTPTDKKKEVRITSHVRLKGSSDYITKGSKTVVIQNADYAIQQAELRKQQSESAAKVRDAQRFLESNTEIALDADLMSYFDSNQQKQVRKFLTTYVAAMISSQTVSYCKESSKVQDKVYSKLGINSKRILLGKKLVGSFGFNAETKYGKKCIQFKLETDAYGFKDKPYASFGTLTWWIPDTSGIPSGVKTSNSVGSMVAYANMKTFAEQLKAVAEDAVENAYQENWGKDANAVAELLVNKTIMQIIDKKYGSFSNGVFTLLLKPSQTFVKNRMKKTNIAVHCPVDVFVYDGSHTLCGAIRNNEVDTDYDSILMYVEDDSKYITLVGDDYYLELVGTDAGEMTYELAEYVDGELTRALAFNDLLLMDGVTYKGYVPEIQEMDSSVYALHSDSGEVVPPDKDTWQEEQIPRVYADGITIDRESAECVIGDKILLKAAVTPDNATYKEVLWKSSDENVAAVDEKGNVRAVSTGTAIITATSYDGSFEASCTVTVKEPQAEKPPVEKPPVGNPPVEKPTITCTHSWDNRENGDWTVKSEATVFNAQTQSRTCSVCGATETRTVGEKLKPTITVNAKTIPMKVKQSTTGLKVTGLAAGDSIASWKSSNKKIVKVSNKGKITAVKKGTATITITLASGKKQKIKVKVQKSKVKTKKISGVSKKIFLKKGKKMTLKPVITPFTSQEKPVYKSYNKKVVSVTSKGKITAKKKGKTRLLIKSGSKKIVCTVIVK